MLHFLLPVLVVLVDGNEPSVALVLQVSGKVTRQQGKAAARPLGLMDQLPANTRLDLPEGAEVWLMIRSDGHHERLTGVGTAALSPRGVVNPKGVRVKSSPAPVVGIGGDLINLHSLAPSNRSGGGTLRGDIPRTPPAITPMYGSAIRSDHPLLRWRALKGAEGYEVELQVVNSKRPSLKLTSATNSLKIPDASSLTRNRKIRWTVVTKQKREPVVEGEFMVLSERQVKSLAALDPLLKQSDVPALVQAAARLQSLGLFDEALEVWERLARLAPKQSRVHAALADYYERAGRRSEADAALKKAEKYGFVRPTP